MITITKDLLLVVNLILLLVDLSYTTYSVPGVESEVTMPHLVLKKAKADDIFDESLKYQYAKEGTNYKLKCKVNHAQALRFWTVDKAGPSEPKYKILYDSDLLIRNVTEEDYSREYFCHTILRGRALVESMQIHLLSKSKVPAFDSSPTENELLPVSIVSSHRSINSKHIYGIIGELKTLQCSVHARPYPEFKWLHRNGTLIHNKTDFIISSVEDASNLTIFMRDSAYYGEYVCEAWNTLGRTEQNFILKMPEKPREIPFIFPRSLGLTKISIGVQYDKSKNYTVNVQYKTAQAFDWDEKWIDNSGDEVSLTNLTSNTTYWIRAALKNQFILGDHSDAIKVTTDKAPDIPTTSNDLMTKEFLQDNKPIGSREGKGRTLSLQDILPGHHPEFYFPKGSQSSLSETKTVNSTTWTSTKMYRDPLSKKTIIMKSTIEEVFDGDSEIPTLIVTEK